MIPITFIDMPICKSFIVKLLVALGFKKKSAQNVLSFQILSPLGELE